jgi:hypothetical protein
MFTKWNNEFDVICGAEIKDDKAEPFADSGLWDLLHGRPDPIKADNPVASSSPPGLWCPPCKF